MDQQLLDEVDADEPTAPAAFAVRDEGSANRVIRRVTEARAYAAKVTAWADREVRRARREEEWFLGRFGGELQEWTRTELISRGGRSRSLKLPAGQVGFRSFPAAVQVIDPTPLTWWCLKHLPAALRVRVDAQGNAVKTLLSLGETHGLDVTIDRRVLITEVLKHVETTGELPPGTGNTTSGEKFYLR